MGWFNWGSSSKEAGPPARQDRKKCWEARDAYFACLDKAGVIVPGEEGKACSAELSSYSQNCAKSWVSGSALKFSLSFLLKYGIILD